jgi:hypothetical protein
MPILDFFKKKTEQKPDEMSGLASLHQSIKKAQAMLSMAELESIRIVSDAKFYKGKLESGFDANLKEATTRSEEILSDEVKKLEADLGKAQLEYTNYLTYLRQDADKSKNDNQELIRQQVNGLFAKFEENLSQFLAQTQQQSVESIELELKATRQLIETYKAQQLKLVDENIISMLERTLSLVLAKRLSLQDQIDLVVESLEKAKEERFIT